MTRTEIQVARSDPNTFAEIVIDDEDDPGKLIRQQDFQRKGHNYLRLYPNLIIEWAREHGKTVNLLLARLLWKMGRQPWRRRIVICAGSSEAQKRISAISHYITGKPIVQRIFPWLLPREKAAWSRSAIEIIRFTPEAVALMSDPQNPISPAEALDRGLTITSKDPSLEARGVLGSGTGARADEIYFDDPVDFQNARGRPALRKLVIEAYLNNWEPVKSKVSGQAAYYGTPWAENDLLAYLRKIAIPVEDPRAETASLEDWRIYRVPVVEREGRYISPWASKFTNEKLQAIRRKVGPAAFAMAYLLEVIGDEDRMFPEATLAKISPITFDQFPTINEDGEQVFDCAVFGGLDLAISQKKTSDWRALATVYLLPNGQRVIGEIKRGRWGSVETIDVLIKEAVKCGYSMVKVENNSAQEAVRQWIQPRVQTHIDAGTIEPGFHLRTSPHTTTSANKLAEEIGLPSLESEFEAGRWSVILPANHTTAGVCPCWFCYFLEEARGFMRNGKSVADHDDTIFALWFAREACLTGRRTGAKSIGDKRTLPQKTSQPTIRKRTDRF